ncbi:MarR family winged helix-turn-helix transcriptional regulator [Streptoalloteichus hindustanus]|uniref:DNA-binding transcriptional regulator, MarR family n=1 Tax=Streptoalloteichus hindustanus TaxID=2017 RepID=A0A1M4UQV7_STRHI|nr:MarR family winged helix-turn-helix transcriptional regulator [Streptoalloteichus hindustanus]SHE59121.1 DNA-binding transcriptional regulator, MarR family [Streptoalloteichus hindustanus]
MTSGSGDAGRRTALDSVERELAVLFRRARSASMALAAKVHPGLDSAAYGLLVLIDDAGPLRGADVVERLGLDKSTVSRQIADLVTLGLAERVPDPSDGRARLVQLTEVGRDRLHQVRSERRRRARERFASWPTDDLEQLARLLARLHDVL